MQETSREKWLQVLESLARSRPDEVEQEWNWLLERLGFGPEYFLAIHQVLQQGRWRTSDNPAAYIKTAARREERRSLDRAAGDGNELAVGSLYSRSEGSTEDFLDHLEYRQDRQLPAREPDNIWRSAPGWHASYDGRQKSNSAHARFSLPKPQNGKLPPGPLARFMDHPKLRNVQEDTNLAPQKQPDWPAWARAAGLNGWEKKAVEYKLSGISRHEALAAQPDEPSRKALQAAWKKLARTGLHRLRRAALGTPSSTFDSDREDEESI